MARKKSSSKGVSDMIAAKMRSDQPVYDPVAGQDPIMRDVQVMNAFNWYNALSTDKKERKWFVDYAKKNGLYSNEQLSTLKVADSKMFVRVGRMCRMIMDGFPLDNDDYTQRRLKEAQETIERYFNQKKETKKVEKKSNRPNPQELMEEKALELTTQILVMMDEYIGDIRDISKGSDSDHVNIESFLNVEEVKPLIAGKILSHIQEAASEWDEAVSEKNEDIQEAYDYLTLSEKKRIQRMYKKVTDSLEARAAVKGKRRGRKKKIKTPEQQVSSVKYLESIKEYGGIKSVDPAKIVGKSRVILFNTKYRQYTILEAENDQIGFTVKGTTIYNIDESKSTCKRIREKYIESLMGTTKSKGIRAIRKEFNGINAKESKATGRINADTLIVKVM